MKRKVFTSFKIALVLFIFQMGSSAIVFSSQFEDNGYYGLAGGVVYGFIFGFWLYWLLSFIYIAIDSESHNRLPKYLRASFVIFIGYFAYHFSDILDHDLVSNFSLPTLLIFLVSIPIMVEIKIHLDKRIKN